MRQSLNTFFFSKSHGIRSRVEFCKKCLSSEELCPQVHQDEGYNFAYRWCRKLKTIKPEMLDFLPEGFKPKKAVNSRRYGYWIITDRLQIAIFASLFLVFI